MASRVTALIFACALVPAGLASASAGTSVKDVESSAKRGDFARAFEQSRELLTTHPAATDAVALKNLFSRFQSIEASGLTSAGKHLDAVKNERDLLTAQSDVAFFARCVAAGVCAPASLAGLQERFRSVAQALILDGSLPVTFESNLLSEWEVSSGQGLTEVLERRIYRNTLPNIAVRDPRDSPSVMMADRLFRFLLRDLQARQEAFSVLEMVCWQPRDFDGLLREVYPELASKWRAELDRRAALDPISDASPAIGVDVVLDAHGVDFGEWVRRFVEGLRKTWIIPYEAMSKRGHVSVAADVHRNGRISDVTVTGASSVGAFNISSSNAVARVTRMPLPPEYLEESVHVVVTFYYNEKIPKK